MTTSWGDDGVEARSQLGPLPQRPLPLAIQMTTVSGPVGPVGPTTMSMIVGVAGAAGFAPFGTLMAKGLPLSSKSCGIGLGSWNGGGVVELPPLLLLFRFDGLSVRNSCSSISCSNAYCEFVAGSVVTSGGCPSPCGVR